jgi:Putative addiction module component
VDLLLTSRAPDADWDAAWGEEAESRLAEYVRGDVKGQDADDVIAAGRRRLAAMRK